MAPHTHGCARRCVACRRRKARTPRRRNRCCACANADRAASVDPEQQLVQAFVRVVDLQQALALRFLQRQEFGQAPADPRGFVEARRRCLRDLAADLFGDVLQHDAERGVLGAQFVVGIVFAPMDIGEQQAVVAHVRGVDVEAPPAANAQVQQPVGAGGEVFDARLRAVLRRRGGHAGLVADQDQAHAEATRILGALAHQVEVAALEHAQRQHRARQQHAVQREQTQRLRMAQHRFGAQRPCRVAKKRRGAPSNPPLDMKTTWSPARTRVRRASIRASASGAVTPSPRSAPTTWPASHANSGRCRNTTTSAPSSEGASASACAPRRIELLRGSIATTMRASPTFARNPASVVAMAVGWCAKSSYTVTPAASPITSRRRFTLRKLDSDDNTDAGSTPTAFTDANAASAFITLWRPSKGQRTSPISRPSCTTTKALPSSDNRRAVQRKAALAALASLPRSPCSCVDAKRGARLASRPKVSTGVQHPIARTSARCWSSPLTIKRPRRGTVRTRWWNWRWIAATSGKMSAWSYSRLLRIATSGR